MCGLVDDRHAPDPDLAHVVKSHGNGTVLSSNDRLTRHDIADPKRAGIRLACNHPNNDVPIRNHAHRRDRTIRYVRLDDNEVADGR